MKFIDINREFTAAANSYMAQGYYINAGTMGGSQGEVAHIDLTNGTEIIRVLLTTFNNYLGTEGVELIVGRVKDDIKPNQEDRWNTVWNERLEVISNKKFYRLNNRAQDGFYGTEEEANAAEEKRFDRYKSRRSNDSALDVTTKAAPMVKKYIHEKFGVRRVKMDATNWFLNHHYLKSYNSPYDCTGQEFTNWFYLFRRRGHWFAYHSVSRDV